MISRPFTICHLVLSLNVGGTEHLVCEMCRDLSRDYRVVICCLDDLGVWGKELRREGFVVFPLYRMPGVDFSVVFQLVAFFKRYQVDLVHAHQYSPFFYGALTRLLYPKARLLFLEHGRHWPEVKKRVKNLFNRLVLQPLTHEIVAVSREIKERLVQYEGLSREKIKVIYNGIKDIPKLSESDKERLRSKWSFSKDDFVVVTVGRLDPIKNLPMFLKSLVVARSKNSTIRGFIIGDGPERLTLESLARSLRLQNDVIFAGFRQDSVELIQIADCFALSSFSEGTSLALLEAMAAGLPCVVTDVGGNPEIVVDGKSGFVVPSGDVLKMAAAFSLLAERPDLAQRMGQFSRQLFETKFTFERMMQQYRALYSKLLGESAAYVRYSRLCESQRA